MSLPMLNKLHNIARIDISITDDNKNCVFYTEQFGSESVWFSKPELEQLIIELTQVKDSLIDPSEIDKD